MISTLCPRPLPEDDPVESDALAAAGTESEPGKNIPVQLTASYLNGAFKAPWCGRIFFVCFCFGVFGGLFCFFGWGFEGFYIKIC